jgi:hypothetical protein
MREMTRKKDGKKHAASILATFGVFSGPTQNRT